MDDLQFQKAEYSGDGPTCASCRASIEREYFQLSGHVICPECAGKVRAGQGRPADSTIVQGALFGLAAAAACGVAYAIFRVVSDYDFSLIAIGVGYLIGLAVRKGTGMGNRLMQGLAVGLTYLAITLSYIPVLVQGATVPPGAWPRVVYVALTLPFLEISESPGSAILGFLILGFGLLQAWRLTAPDPRPLTGPFERSQETAASA